MTDQKATREGWPPNVHPISWDATARLGIGEDNKLYRDGKEVVTRQSLKLDLTLWERVFVIGAALAVIASAVVEVLRFFGYGAGQS